MNDFRAEPEALKDAMLKAASEVIDSGWYVLGQQVKEFETQWAESCHAKFASGVANGMDAIELGLRALSIGPGDEVITTGMTAFPSALAILRAGATPVLADIDPDTALLDIESTKKCITPKTKAVLLVHLYGQIKNMKAWKELCDESGIALIEDCAQSHLAREDGVTAGNFGAFGAYSFYPTKNLGALGDAGALVTNDKELHEKVNCLRNYGQSERYHHPHIGANSRLDELQAAILLKRLSWLPEFTQRRQEIADRYWSGIENSKLTPLARPNNKENHVHHLFVLKTNHRTELQEHLKKHEVASLIHYPIPINEQKPTTNLTTAPDGLPNTIEHAKTCLSIPCHPQMTDAQVDRVIEVINEF